MANLAKASSEPGQYKGTYPSVLRGPEGRESRRQVRGKPRRSRLPVSSSSSPPSPSSTPRRRHPRHLLHLHHAGDDLAIIFIFPVVRKESELATSSTPNRGRGASQGSVGRSHGAPVHLRKLGRLIFYLLSVFLQIACTHPPLAFGDPSSVSPRCCSSTLMVETSR